MQGAQKFASSTRARFPAALARPGFWRMIQRRLPQGAGALASLALFVLALTLLGRILSKINLADFGDAIVATSGGQIFQALALTALSYLALTGYDVVALRQIGARTTYRIAALASFASCAISFNLGFPIVTAAAARFWVYSRAQLTALQVANITLFAGVTFWLGMTLMIGVGLAFGAVPLAQIDRLPAFVNFLLGAAIIGAIVFYCGWVSVAHRRIRIRDHALELPGAGCTLAQLALGAADLCAASGALYVLLPAGVALDFIPFMAVYVFACVLGVASHAPGGIGVFEATMLAALPGASQESVLASLLLFRVIYYFLPLLLALALLGANEGARRWSSLRAAVARIIDARGA